MSEAGNEKRGAGRVTLDHLIALNDEIVALTRAGGPIEPGVLDLGSGVPGKLGRIAPALGARLGGGCSTAGRTPRAGSAGSPGRWARGGAAGTTWPWRGRRRR